MFTSQFIVSLASWCQGQTAMVTDQGKITTMPRYSPCRDIVLP